MPPFVLHRLGEKNLKLVSPRMIGYMGEKEERDAHIKELFELIQSGKVKFDVHDVYPLKDATRAHEDLEGRKTTGKLLLKV